MTVDLRTLFLVWQRLDNASRYPRLFHDGMTPSMVRRRMARFLRWVGPYQVWALMDAAKLREVPKPGKRKFARHWPDEERRRQE